MLILDWFLAGSRTTGDFDRGYSETKTAKVQENLKRELFSLLKQKQVGFQRTPSSLTDDSRGSRSPERHLWSLRREDSSDCKKFEMLGSGGTFRSVASDASHATPTNLKNAQNGFGDEEYDPSGRDQSPGYMESSKLSSRIGFPMEPMESPRKVEFGGHSPKRRECPKRSGFDSPSGMLRNPRKNLDAENEMDTTRMPTEENVVRVMSGGVSPRRTDPMTEESDSGEAIRAAIKLKKIKNKRARKRRGSLESVKAVSSTRGSLKSIGKMASLLFGAGMSKVLKKTTADTESYDGDDYRNILKSPDSSDDVMDRYVEINVGGIRYETQIRVLRRYQHTLLSDETFPGGQLHDMGYLFLDRDPMTFTSVLNYYRTDQLHMPDYLSPEVWEMELEFYRLEIPNHDIPTEEEFHMEQVNT